eukprot:3193617-Prymnesium_polylepis.1
MVTNERQLTPGMELHAAQSAETRLAANELSTACRPVGDHERLGQRHLAPRGAWHVVRSAWGACRSDCGMMRPNARRDTVRCCMLRHNTSSTLGCAKDATICHDVLRRARDAPPHLAAVASL